MLISKKVNDKMDVNFLKNGFLADRWIRHSLLPDNWFAKTVDNEGGLGTGLKFVTNTNQVIWRKMNTLKYMESHDFDDNQNVQCRRTLLRWCDWYWPRSSYPPSPIPPTSWQKLWTTSGSTPTTSTWSSSSMPWESLIVSLLIPFIVHQWQQWWRGQWSSDLSSPRLPHSDSFPDLNVDIMLVKSFRNRVSHIQFK